MSELQVMVLYTRSARELTSSLQVTLLRHCSGSPFWSSIPRRTNRSMSCYPTPTSRSRTAPFTRLSRTSSRARRSRSFSRPRHSPWACSRPRRRYGIRHRHRCARPHRRRLSAAPYMRAASRTLRSGTRSEWRRSLACRRSSASVHRQRCTRACGYGESLGVKAIGWGWVRGGFARRR